MFPFSSSNWSYSLFPGLPPPLRFVNMDLVSIQAICRGRLVCAFSIKIVWRSRILFLKMQNLFENEKPSKLAWTYILDVLRQHRRGPRDERCRRFRLRRTPSRRIREPPSPAGRRRQCPSPACALTWTSPGWQKKMRIGREWLVGEKSPGGRKRRSLPPSGASRAGWGGQRGCRCKRGRGEAPPFFGSDHAAAWSSLGCLTAAMLNC